MAWKMNRETNPLEGEDGKMGKNMDPLGTGRLCVSCGAVEPLPDSDRCRSCQSEHEAGGGA